MRKREGAAWVSQDQDYYVCYGFNTSGGWMGPVVLVYIHLVVVAGHSADVVVPSD